MNKETLNAINNSKDNYVCCGMIKLAGHSGIYYVGSGKIYDDFEEEFEVVINSIDDFLPLDQWTAEDYANAIDGELENQNYHSFKMPPHKVLEALPKYIEDIERKKILLSLFDWII